MNVRDRIDELSGHMTASERKVASVLLADYPFAGLQTIQELAQRVRVSAPSITRFVSKIGCAGYLDFQRMLIDELKESNKSPVQLKLTENPSRQDRFLNEYIQRTIDHLQSMKGAVSQESFDAVCNLLSDPSRAIFVIGGRMSDKVAGLLANHLRQIRGRIHHIPSDPELWPDYVLRMRKQDVVVFFDYRRYQPNLMDLAQVIAEQRQSNIVVVTDKWLTPIARHGTHILAVPVEIGTAWDSHACTIALIEAFIVKVSEADWTATRKRIVSWDQVRMKTLAIDPEDDDRH